jgi:hypothetical protein
MMIAVAVVALSLRVGPASPAKALDDRMAESAAAAQAFQGPLDGGWTLRDMRGRVLYRLQIADPPQAAAPAQGAWRAPETGALGALDSIARSGDQTTIVFRPEPDGRRVRIKLIRRRVGDWRGWMTSSRGRQAVQLTRDESAASTTFRMSPGP